MQKLSLLSLVAVPLVLSVAACSGGGGGMGDDDDDGSGAQVNVAFQNEAEPVAFAESATVFGMKLIAVYVTEDIDEGGGNNSGQTSMIYLNPQCNENIFDCDISAGTNGNGQPYANIVSDFFDFAQPTADVNADLVATPRTVAVGSYKYARIEFCKTNDADAANIRYQGGAMAAPVEFQRNNCTVNSEEIVPPIVISNTTSTLTVNIAYDYSLSITTAGGISGDHCDTSTDPDTCFTLPQFVPSVSL